MRAILAVGFTLCATQALADVALTKGTYLWKPEFGGCAWLVVTNRLRYHYDNDCDGDRDYVGKNVRLDGQNISVDAAYLAVHSADENRIVGTWVFKGQYAAEFVKK